MSGFPILDQKLQPKEEWRSGVATQMHVSAETGSNQLCIFEQWCEPGHGAPMHSHAVEEVLMVVSGTARVTVASQNRELTAGQSAVVPAGILHGFTNTGADVLHVRAILAAPVFEAAYEDRTETPRRWLPPDGTR